MTPENDHRNFWERRLASDWTESGVGYHALGRPFNTWVYRVRREVFLREAGALGLRKASRVLDVGSGTGEYVRCWQQLGVGEVVGSDLTEAAVTKLREHHTGVEFVQLDITETDSDLPAATFDAVSCIDVLFHITDDNRYLAAIDNIARAVRPGGYFVLSENFLRRPPDYTAHQVSRTEEWIVSALGEAGFEVQRRVPMLVLMNALVDAPKPVRKVWGGALRAFTLTQPTGWAAGAALYPIERQLVRRLHRSPTTELMICRRA
ncbi:class I SAM-dependent methyltransferase [Phytoactinopolyspora mesophila]|uniref:Methyltransferase domain-containing protein n=1 Tax=Phytoactinopolyspora mesophila TaxID=2650750 RepID=A0A7K3M757_9ACTN|nr:class I SAM-dependent methyltransferase [Phytoactinopolyspora mesophila]NDL58248.1 methyltransferase domain-containing protein [Phytoactinopolyspora mesophila]